MPWHSERRPAWAIGPRERGGRSRSLRQQQLLWQRRPQQKQLRPELHLNFKARDVAEQRRTFSCRGTGHDAAAAQQQMLLEGRSNPHSYILHQSKSGRSAARRAYTSSISLFDIGACRMSLYAPLVYCCRSMSLFRSRMYAQVQARRGTVVGGQGARCLVDANGYCLLVRCCSTLYSCGVMCVVGAHVPQQQSVLRYGCTVHSNVSFERLLILNLGKIVV